jgi:hypothetical protein
VDADLVDRFGIAGPPELLVARLRELTALGLDRIVFNTRIRGASEREQAEVARLLLTEVLPHVTDRKPDRDLGGRA